MSDEKKLGTCDDLQDVKHPYDSFECQNWQPCEPVASPQATRPDDRCSYEEPHAAHTWNGRPMIFCPGIPGLPEWRKCPQCSRENSVETWQKHGNKCPNCDDLFERDAAQPADGTTPHIHECDHETEGEHVCRCVICGKHIGTPPGEPTTPQAERPAKAKLPIDRPCSACSAGDPEMKYHDHSPPFRAVAPVETPLTSAKEFYSEWTNKKFPLQPLTLPTVYEWLEFAEAFRDKSEAGLREEIERLKEGERLVRDFLERDYGVSEITTICSRYDDAEQALTELRAKLAEQERAK